MNSNYFLSTTIRLFCSFSLLATIVGQTNADPLPGRDLLKFSQQPQLQTTFANADGTVKTFFGHDEVSTAYGFPGSDPTGQIDVYRGRFMADDFADGFNSPVVHVKFWGSYLRDLINPDFPVNKFLISFESDIPADPNDPNGFSRPGQPLLNQVVFRDSDGVLKPGEGSFTEKPIRGPDPILGESVYEYNAELHLDKSFPEKADTVYWLKIAALIDVPANVQFDPTQPGPNVTQWGWHNRDYTIPNPLASTPPAVVPGESKVGTIGGAPVFHFQDDAVEGDLVVFANTAGGIVMPGIEQFNFNPTNYLDGIDGPGPIPGTPEGGIGRFSKDLAFELYTTIPEPSTCLLMLVSLCGLVTRRR